MDYESYVDQQLAAYVNRIDNDPYAVGLFIKFDDDDLRRPCVEFISNTAENADARLRGDNLDEFHTATSILDATWNCFHWQTKAWGMIGSGYGYDDQPLIQIDEVGMALREEWIKKQGLWYTDEFEEDNFDEAFELGGQIHHAHNELCVRAARRLHRVIEAKFGREMPIIMFGRECPDPETMMLTFLVNPAHLLEGYVDFLRDRGNDDWADWMSQDCPKDDLTFAGLWKDMMGDR